MKVSIHFYCFTFILLGNISKNINSICIEITLDCQLQLQFGFGYESAGKTDESALRVIWLYGNLMKSILYLFIILWVIYPFALVKFIINYSILTYIYIFYFICILYLIVVKQLPADCCICVSSFSPSCTYIQIQVNMYSFMGAFVFFPPSCA